MKTTLNFIFSDDPAYRAGLGHYREIKVKGADEVHGVRIETGDVWDMDHLITHGLALDGFVFVRKERIWAELNTDRYDKVDFLLALGEIPDAPEVQPELDSDRELFEWLREQGKLVMVFLSGQPESIMGRVEVVGNKSYQLRIVNDELEVAEELVEIHYSMVPMVVVGTHLLRMFEKYLEVTGEASEPL